MRLKVCLGIILLGLGACTTIPGFVRLEVDGSTIEFNKKPEPEPPAAASPATEGEASADVPER
jgi:hypothetical protein